MKRGFILLAALLLLACGGENKEKNGNMNRAAANQVVSYVDTMRLGQRSFDKQILCNGKLYAINKSKLAFKGSGILQEIKSFNGSEVKKGDLLAVLNTEDAAIAYNKAQKSLRKSWIDLTDKLIGQGYDADTTAVPKDILNNIKMSSGYDSAVDALKDAKRTLDNCYLYAPFGGRVANMDSKRYQAPENGVFCTLIDDSYFNVEFSLLEAELGEIRVGQVVDVSPFINDKIELKGEVTEINPLIDDKGQIKVRARVKNENGALMEGMNVMLTINEKIENQYVVPKDAVVSRDGFFVVFRYEEGTAVWTYVDIVMSNVDSHVISGNKKKQTKINANDVIITKGNLNLADGTAVTINKK